MLEIRNLTKVYHSKNGNSVTALDNVSVSFPETGMVFVLGKSGSGKSTLLNVIGGLDGYDSGEFVIKGKSSKDFGGSDFDAYRNTFIGFIFQEYNILDDFTVGANIGLALELQGKKATSEVISSILAQVDMLDYAKRRPNELSGGQKQRIAIARALVKDPEIIMADEPTGALDSNTGKQIFDTLKELSKSKLVIVVSHDRDFAEKYGDRIIEMKDGKILSDITKHQVAAREVSSGILQMNDNLLRIEKGYQLTAEDVKLINEYLRRQETEILISGDRRINDGVKVTAGISEDNTSAVFKDTDEAVDVKKKSYDKKDAKFIRSRLPMKNALKMGSSSLGHKKFRLVITILLSLIAFALFGFADSMGAYDKIIAATDSIVDTGITNASYSLGVKHKWVYSDGDESVYYQSAAMNEEDLKTLSEKAGMSFIPVFNGTAGEGRDSNISLEHMMLKSDKLEMNNSAYTSKLYGFTAAGASDLSSLNFNLVGKMAEAEDEIVITEFMCRQFNLAGFQNEEKGEKIEAGQLTTDPSGGDNSIIGKHLTVKLQGMNYTFKICGVIDTRFDYDRYADFIPTDSSKEPVQDESIMHMIMATELENTLSYGFHGLGYITETALDKMAEMTKFNMGSMTYIGISTNGWNLTLQQDSKDSGAEGGIQGGIQGGMIKAKDSVDIGEVFVDSIGSSNQIAWFYRVAQSSDIQSLGEITWFDGTPRTTLGANEILICEEHLNGMSLTADITDEVDEILSKQYGMSIEEMEKFHSLQDILNTLANEKYNAYVISDEFFEANKAQIEELYRSYNGVIEGEPVDENALRDEWKARAEEWIWQIPDITSREEMQLEAYRSFCQELFGKTYNEKYNLDFYSKLLDCISCDMNTQSIFVSDDSYTRMLIVEYAYATVYGNPAICDDEEFIDKVISQRYHDKDGWATSKNVETAASLYVDYIQNDTQHMEEEPYAGKGYSDFEEEGKKLFAEKTGINASSLLEGTYLSNRYWDNKGNEISKKLDNYVVVGTFKNNSGNDRELIVSDTLYSEYEAYRETQNMAVEIISPHEQGIYAFAIAPMPTDRDAIERLVTLSYDRSGDYSFELQNQVMDTLDGFNDFIEVGAQVFLYIGIGFAVFSALMLMNFISVSISYKRREIGILRAVGARSSDVFKIFFCEAFIIALINYILSVAATIAATTVFNNIVREEGINVTLLHFGPRQLILMLLISIAVAAIASFLPVWNIARRKPVDAIKNK